MFDIKLGRFQIQGMPGHPEIYVKEENTEIGNKGAGERAKMQAGPSKEARPSQALSSEALPGCGRESPLTRGLMWAAGDRK